MHSKKRLLVGLLFGLTMFGAVMGSAASLGGLTADGLGADDALVASCDSDGVSTSYSTQYNSSGTAGYKIATVTVSGLANTCDGETIEVRLTNSSGTSLEAVSKTIETDAGATSTELTFAGTTLVEDVTGVHVVVSG